MNRMKWGDDKNRPDNDDGEHDDDDDDENGEKAVAFRCRIFRRR